MFVTHRKPKILIVDDVEANLLALEALLETVECEVFRARSGNDALRLLLLHEFAVMLLDVQMPEMDGYEVAQYARDNPKSREVPILFVTAMHHAEQAALRGYGAGAVDFLFKPINPQILRSKVTVFLELYQNRKQLADALEAHREAVAELDAFNYSVSHDLRAPLRPLEGFSQALLEDHAGQLDDQGREYLQRIIGAAKRMGQLIEDLLLLSRMGRAPVRSKALDLAPIAQEIIAEQTRIEPEHRVQFVSVEKAEVAGDPGLLRIVLENLLRNAWKFTRKQDSPRIEFGVLREDNRTVYFVRDNGAGFDSSYSDKLFVPFQRLHSASEFEGTGIGLAIVQRIIRRHGGKVWAEGQPGVGATFFFTLGAEP